MTLDYTHTWEVMNELESVTSRICSAREILESALIALENHKYDKAEVLMYATDEYLQYYLKDFDEKFKTAWSETVVKLNKDQYSYLANDTLTQYRVSNFPGEQYPEEVLNAMCDKAEQDQIIFCDKNNSSEECKESWGDFWSFDTVSAYDYPPGAGFVSPTFANYSKDTITFNLPEKNKVKKWILPVQEMENGDTMENEYFIQLPDDLLEQVNWKENDELHWEDNGDGTFTLRKVNG